MLFRHHWAKRWVSKSRFATQTCLVRSRPIADIGASLHPGGMSDRELFPQREAPEPPLPCREIERIRSGPGTIIVFESMEDRVFESRNPHHEHIVNVPILRAVLQNNGWYIGERRRWTIVIEGLSEDGSLFETAELVYVDAARDRHLTGYAFSSGVKSVRVIGWCFEPAE